MNIQQTQKVNDSFPQYDGTEDLCTYRAKLNAYLLNSKKEEYNIILEFANKLFEKQHKSLGEFKNLDMTMYKMCDALSIINDYVSIFNKKFKLKLNIDDLKDDEEMIDYMVKIVRQLMVRINFSFPRKKIGKKYYYSIISEPASTKIKNELKSSH
jgi:hypothetical protein